MSRTQVTIERQRLQDLAARLHIATRMVAIAGCYPIGAVQEHPTVELERIETELRALAREA